MRRFTARQRARYRRPVRTTAVALLGAWVIACGGSGSDAASSSSSSPPALASAAAADRAPLEPFTPPSPRGCAAAGAYDFCFAFDTGTPLAVHVALPRAASAGAPAVVRFARVVAGVPKRNLDEVKFTLERGGDELVLYFQVDPAEYRVGFGFGEGADEVFGWSPIVEVGAAPVATRFTLDAP
jgi:hypothetical protein